ncbi:Helitron helicase [Phytophthora megakarya]|uniref:Helitron helicase n=1 Tax=Phytophthora megakarya TaxID=4795 RepID=A0A225WSH4_9STRA|nr:Helitron helicase [Phytophthora megakarya]
MVHDAAPSSDKVTPGADDAGDGRRTRNVSALIDRVYPDINAGELPNEYFHVSPPKQASIFRPTEGVVDRNLFEQEFINSLNFSRIPPHKIALKVGTPIIMIRNLNSDAGLCNGTRLRVVSLAREERSIEATVMSGSAKGNIVFIPRSIFYTEDDAMAFPFKLKRKQFPVVPAFAMTINNAQESPVFAHGQLNVAISRVTSQKAIKFTVGPEMIDVGSRAHTKTIVSRDIFDHEVA